MDTTEKTVDEKILEAAEAEGWTAGDAASDWFASGDVYGMDVLEQVWEQIEQLDLPGVIKGKLDLVLSEQNIADLLGYDFVSSAMEYLADCDPTPEALEAWEAEYEAKVAEEWTEAKEEILANIAVNYVIADVKPLKNSDS